MKQTSVVQPWLEENCSWKEQTVLLGAFRGCDGEQKGDASKNLLHNFRALIMKDADPSSPFMQEREIDIDHFCNNIDHYPVHWLLHFTHAAEIIGYRHPDKEIATKWISYYYTIVNAFHLNPETNAQLTERLEDKVQGGGEVT